MLNNMVRDNNPLLYIYDIYRVSDWMNDWLVPCVCKIFWTRSFKLKTNLNKCQLHSLIHLYISLTLQLQVVFDCWTHKRVLNLNSLRCWCCQCQPTLGLHYAQWTFGGFRLKIGSNCWFHVDLRFVYSTRFINYIHYFLRLFVASGITHNIV